MKIVILHPPLYPVNHALFNILGKYCQLHVICFGSQPGYHECWNTSTFINENNNYKLTVLKGKTDKKKLSVPLKLQCSPKYLKIIINEKPDVLVSVAFWIPSFVGALYNPLSNYKLCVLTDANQYSDGNIGFLRRALRKIIVSNSDVLISSSKLTTKYLTKFSNNKVKIAESPQAINISLWRKELTLLANKEELRIKHNFFKGDKLLLFVGALEEKKNVHSILDQLVHLEQHKLIVVGNGAYMHNLVEKSRKLKLQDRVLFVGRKEKKELMEYYVLSDVLVFPSISDQFGFVVPEALIAGTPVICSKFTGASCLVSNGMNGYLIDPTKNYVDKINLCFNNIEILSKNSMKSISNYTLENKAIELAKIFKEVLS